MTHPTRPLLAVFALLMCFAMAGWLQAAPAPAAAPHSGAEDLYHSNRVVRIEITLPKADWDALCAQERDAKAELGRERTTGKVQRPYSWFKADVIIDGTRLKDVGIRKRGFFGSGDSVRPALNLDLDRFSKGQRFLGRRELKLHNNKQDPTGVRQSVGYGLFRAAGVPAPGCNLAHVTVNGTDLGCYSNLEPIDDIFLKRWFGEAGGNLYEAQISDFRPGWVATFQKKNNPESGRDDIEAVARALATEDPRWLETLEQHLDLDAFINFWAMEVLVNHWDGFAGHLNNCFVYRDPRSGKLRFIPWGADSILGSHHLFVPFEPPASVWAVSLLTRRLYNHPVTQKKYRARLAEILATTWKPADLNTELARLEKLAQGINSQPPFVVVPEWARLRSFVQGRKAILDAELALPATPWEHPMRSQPFLTQVGRVSVEFASGWVPSVFAPAPEGARAKVTIEFSGRRYTADFNDVKGTIDISNPTNAVLLVTGRFPGISVPVSIWAGTAASRFEPNRDIDLSARGSGLVLVAGTPGSPDFRLLGNSSSGSLQLVEAGKSPGDKVRGRLEAQIESIPWDDFDLARLHRVGN